MYLSQCPIVKAFIKLFIHRKKKKKTKNKSIIGAILMFILIDIICAASLVYLYIEKRNEKKKLQA